MDNILYNFIYSLIKTYEDSSDREELIEGFSRAFSLFFPMCNMKIYLMDEFSYTLKDFTKPWENLNFDNKNSEIKKYFDNFLIKKSDYEIFGNFLYFPIVQKHKTLGIVEVKSSKLIDKNNDFITLLPLVTAQISMIIATLKNKEQIKLTSKFHQTLKNIAQITQTQYELDYILPIMGEMIDQFVSDHLIYIFIKNKNKKEYKLIWPNKCSDEKIYEYLERISPKSDTIIERDGKMGIFPLIVDSKPYGAIVAYNHFDKITTREIEYLEEIKNQASATLTRAKSYIEVLEHATLDALTGYNNRHQFEKRLKETTAASKRQNMPLCCIMSDIDFFKKVNDTYGHAVGDCVLKTVAKTIKKELREEDIPSRYGGEEFIFLLPHTNLEEAHVVAQRLRHAVQNKKINIEEYKIEGVKEISVTVSIGVSQFDKTKDKDPEMLYKHADLALYEAKESGRNRVIVYKD
ncbi:sensor domain-containing diguanylate cyclase [bacterium]|nr:sensor domain-containing diguanylate cyclase [bacterium]